jgi:hypothetical protein
MSFDIFLQAFKGGEAGTADPSVITNILDPYVSQRNGDDEYVRLVTEDGEAACYGYGTEGLMVNYASGEHIWDLLVQVAKAAGLVIMPVGCPVSVTDPSQIADVPPGFFDKFVVVSTGADLVRSIKEA